MIFEKYAMPLLKSGMKVLEVGVGKRYWKSPYRKQVKERGWDYRFCDFGNFGSDESDFVRQDGEYGIAAGAEFDAVISQQTLEHVRKPWIWVKVLAGLLKPGGLLVLVAPLTWVPHKNPWDSFRILPDGMRSLLEEAGLDTVVVKAEHLGQTPEEQKCQWGGVAVMDVIGIGRKPRDNNADYQEALAGFGASLRSRYQSHP